MYLIKILFYCCCVNFFSFNMFFFIKTLAFCFMDFVFKIFEYKIFTFSAIYKEYKNNFEPFGFKFKD